MSPKGEIWPDFCRRTKGEGAGERVVHTAPSPLTPPSPEHKEEDILGLAEAETEAQWTHEK